MAGGHATSSGISFQNEVAAWMAVHILAERQVPDVGPGSPVALRLEALSPVDDIVVSTKESGRWFINVKSTVSVSDRQNSELSSVVDQFVRQWLVGCAEGHETAGVGRRLDPSLDRLVLVVKGGRSRNLVDAATPILQRLSDGASQGWPSPVATTAAETAVYNAFDTLIRYHWQRQKGDAVRGNEVHQILGSSGKSYGEMR